MKKSILYAFAALFLPALTFAQPANDNCSGAIPIEIDGAAVTADNSNATIYGEPGSCFFGEQIDGDVWFSITLTEAAAISISTTAGTSTDSQLALFSIEDCGGPGETFTEVGCNDDASFAIPMSEILTNVLEPGTYYLRAGTYGDTNSGTYDITVSSVSFPDNDTCDGATELVLDGDTLIADNSVSTINGPSGTCYGYPQEVGETWFTFTLSEETSVRVFTEEGSSEDSQVSVFTIEGCGTGNEVYTEVGCNDDISNDNYMSAVNLYMLPAGTYYVKAGTYSTFFTGTYNIALQTIELGDIPENSACEDAQIQNLAIDGSLVSVTGSGTDAIDIEGLGIEHVWEAFTIDGCADVTLDMCGTPVVPESYFSSLISGCPLSEGEVYTTDDINTTSCESDENITAYFPALPAGTYYYPVISSPASTLDEYTINFTATVCAPEPDSCLTYENGPYINFNDMFGGAPVPDEQGDCESFQITDFEVAASESYTIDGFAANTTYTFSICEGPGAGAWEPVISVSDPDGNFVAYEENCSISWTTQMAGTYVIGISELGACTTSYNTETGNGYPTLTCNGSVGIEAIEKDEFSIYPNPAKGQFSIRTQGASGKYTIELIDMSGRKVHSQMAVINNNTEALVQTGSLAPGVYLVKMINKMDNSISNQRVVIR